MFARRLRNQAPELAVLDGAEVFVVVDNVSDGLSSVPDMAELYPGTKLAMRTWPAAISVLPISVDLKDSRRFRSATSFKRPPSRQ